MANHKIQTTIQIGYTTDNASLNKVKQTLRELQSMTTVDFIRKSGATMTDQMKAEFNEAKRVAGQIETALQKAYNPKIDGTNVTKFNNELKKSGISAESMWKSLSKTAEGKAAFHQLASSIASANTEMKQSSKLLNDMAISMVNTVKWNITSSIMNNFTAAVQQAYGYVKHLDSSLNDIRIVTGANADEMERFARNANKAAQGLGKATTDYTEASLIYYQQGLGDADVAARTETTLKAANVTGQSTADVSEQLTAVWNGYKVSAEEAEMYVDKLQAVARTTASDLEELSTGMSKVASAANLMGVDVDQLNAQLATIVSVTRQAPESVGTALKTIYARMGDIKAGTDSEVTLGRYTSQMAGMGFNVLDANNELRDMGEVIEEVGNKWEDLTREQQINLAQIMAGARQYNNLLSLFDNWDMYTSALDTSRNSVGELQKAQDIYMQSTKAHLQQLSTAVEGVYSSLWETDEFNKFIDAITSIVNKVQQMIETFGGLKGVLAGLLPTFTALFSQSIAKSTATMANNVSRAFTNTKQIKQRTSYAQYQYETVMSKEHNEADEVAARANYNLAKYSEDMSPEQKSDYLQQIQQVTELSKAIEETKLKEAELQETVAESVAAFTNQVESSEALKKSMGGNLKSAEDYKAKLMELQIEAKKIQTESNTPMTSMQVTTQLAIKQGIVGEDPFQGFDPDEVITYFNELKKLEDEQKKLEDELKKTGEEEENHRQAINALIQENIEKQVQLNNATNQGIVEKAQEEDGEGWGGFKEAAISAVNELNEALNGIDIEESVKQQKQFAEETEELNGQVEIENENLNGTKGALKNLNFEKVIQGTINYASAIAQITNTIVGVYDIIKNDDLDWSDKILAIIPLVPGIIGAITSIFSAYQSLQFQMDKTGAAAVNSGTQMAESAVGAAAAANGAGAAANGAGAAMSGAAVSVGTLAAALGVVALIIAGAAVAYKIVKKNAEEADKAAQEQYETAQKQADTAWEHKKAIDELADSYNKLEEKFSKSEITLEQLREQTYKLCQEYGLQDEAVQTLTASYDDLSKIAAKAKKEANDAVLAASDEALSKAIISLQTNNKNKLSGSTKGSGGTAYEDEKSGKLVSYAELGRQNLEDIADILKIDVDSFSSDVIDKYSNRDFDFTSDEFIQAFAENYDDLKQYYTDMVNDKRERIDPQVKAALNELFADKNQEMFGNIADLVAQRTEAAVDSVKSVFDAEDGTITNLSELNAYLEEEIPKLALEYGVNVDKLKKEFLKNFLGNYDNKDIAIDYNLQEKYGGKISENQIAKMSSGQKAFLSNIDENADIFNFYNERYSTNTHSDLLSRFENYISGTEQIELINSAQSMLQNIAQTGEVTEATIDSIYEKFAKENGKFNDLTKEEFQNLSTADQITAINKYYDTIYDSFNQARQKILEELQKRIDEAEAIAEKSQKKLQKDRANYDAVTYNKLDKKEQTDFIKLIKDTQALADLYNTDESKYTEEQAQSLELLNKLYGEHTQTVLADANQVIANGDAVADLIDYQTEMSQVTENNEVKIKAYITTAKKGFEDLKSSYEDVQKMQKLDGQILDLGNYEEIQSLIEQYNQYGNVIEIIDGKIKIHYEELDKYRKEEHNKSINAAKDAMDVAQAELNKASAAILSAEFMRHASEADKEKASQAMADAQKAYDEAVAYYNLLSQVDISSGTGNGEPNLPDYDTEPLREYDKKLQDISDRLSELKDKESNLFGPALAENFREQNQLLEEQKQILEDRITAEENILNEKRNKLDGAGIDFDADGNITNYTEVMERLNANSDPNDYYNAIKDYESTLNDIVDKRKEETELLERQKELQLEITKLGIEHAFRSSDAQRDNLNDKLTNTRNRRTSLETQIEETSDPQERLELQHQLNDALAEEQGYLEQIAATEVDVEATFKDQMTKLLPKRDWTSRADAENELLGLYDKLHKAQNDKDEAGQASAQAEIDKLLEDLKIFDILKSEYDDSIERAQKSKEELEKIADEMESHEVFNEADKLMDSDAAIKQVTRDLQKLQKAQKNLKGADLVKNLQQQNALLKKQIELEKRKLEIASLQAKLALQNANVELQKQGLSIRLELSKDGILLNELEIREQLVGLNEKESAQILQLIEDYKKYSESVMSIQDSVQDLLLTIDSNNSSIVDAQTEETKEKVDKAIDDTAKKAEDAAKKAAELAQKEMEERLRMFNLKVDVELDISDASRRLTKLKDQIAGLKDTDIFGTVKAQLEEYMTYFRGNVNSYFSGDTGAITGLTKHVGAIISEINKMQAGGKSNLYGDDQHQAFEDLKKYRDSLMSQLEKVQEISEQIHEAYDKMIDKIADKFSDIGKNFKQVNDIAKNNINLIKMLYGDDAYAQMQHYYDIQAKNNSEYVAEAKAQADYWKNKMDSAVPGSEAWDKYQEKWTSAVTELNSLVSQSIQNLIDGYQNGIKKIAQDAQKQLTNGSNFKDVSDDWKKQLEASDRYYDAVNRQYETSALRNKFNDAIDNAKDSIAAQTRIRDLMNEQLDIITKKEKVSEYDVQRAEKLLDIELKRQALEDAQNNKSKMKLRRDSQGNYRYQYVADQDDIASKKNELEAAQNDLYNFDKKRARSTYQEYLNYMDEYWTKWTELQNDTTLTEEERQNKLLGLNKYYADLTNDVLRDANDARTNIYSSAIDSLNASGAEVVALTQAEKERLVNDIVPEMKGAVDELIARFGKDPGAMQYVIDEATNEAESKFQALQETVHNVEEQAGQDFEAIAAGIEPAIDATNKLRETNEDLLESFEDELQGIEDLISELDQLIAKYQEATREALAMVDASLKPREEAKTITADDDDSESNASTNNEKAKASATTTGANPVDTTGKADNGKTGAAKLQHFPLYTDATLSSYLDARVQGSVPQGQFPIDINVNKIYGDKVKFSITDVDANKDLKKYAKKFGVNLQSTWWTYKNAIKFDTGGYTGSWNDHSGKLAMLHQKEIVLNKSDTENFLAAVKIVRDMGTLLQNLQNNVNSNISALSSTVSVAAPMAPQNSTLEQNVTISATFPNVQDSDEIREAFESLSNIASQRALNLKR